MDPVEHLRALREDTRWVEEQLDFDAHVLPVRRRWSRPRIAVVSVATAALVGVVAAALAGAIALNHGAVKPMPAGPTATASPVELPECALDQLQLGYTGYTPAQHWDQLRKAGWITAKNTSNAGCSLPGDATPSVQWADDAVTPLGGDTDSLAGPNGADLVLSPGEVASVAFLSYVSPGPQAACLQVAPGLMLDLPGWSGAGFVSDAGTGYCLNPPHLVNWPFSAHMDPAVLDDAVADYAKNGPPPTGAPTTDPLGNGGQCTADELSAELAPDRGSDQGTDWAIITVRDIGARQCAIGPTTTLVWEAGQGGPAAGSPATTGLSQNSAATLTPGESAGVIIGFVQAAEHSAQCRSEPGQWLALDLMDAQGRNGVQLEVDVSALGQRRCIGDVQQLKVFEPNPGASLVD